jgi:hypothetical protein
MVNAAGELVRRNWELGLSCACVLTVIDKKFKIILLISPALLFLRRRDGRAV